MSGKDGYIPSMAAELAGLTVKSVRRIVVKFPEAFSPGARGAPGRRGNRFTVEDVDRLKVLKGREKESLWYIVNYPILVNRVPAGQAEEASVESFTAEVRKLRREVRELHDEVFALKQFKQNYLMFNDDRQAEVDRLDLRIHNLHLKVDQFNKDQIKESSRVAIMLQAQIDDLKDRTRLVDWGWLDLLKYTVFGHR